MFFKTNLSLETKPSASYLDIKIKFFDSKMYFKIWKLCCQKTSKWLKLAHNQHFYLLKLISKTIFVAKILWKFITVRKMKRYIRRSLVFLLKVVFLFSFPAKNMSNRVRKREREKAFKFIVSEHKAKKRKKLKKKKKNIWTITAE